jgi:glycosyltransferase involved in cell wall biosynthesis/ribosomal protein S18 acetylase RimI-like enzyme
MSLRYLLLPQLDAAREMGESLGISAAGEFVPDLEARGIRHIALASSTRGMNLMADARAIGQLWSVLRRERPDILHTHNPKPGVYGRIVGRLAGVPIVVNTVHGLYATPESSFLKRVIVYTLEWVASRFSDAELIQSPEDFELLWQRKIMPRSKLRLLGNGVDLARFDPKRAAGSRAEVRAELGVAEDRIVVGMVGRLVAEKGVPELVEAAEILDHRYLIVVIGPIDPVKDDALGRDVIARGRMAGVLFLGMRRDLDRLYGGLDLFVLPSHREGFPRAAMEAAASGLPVIATDIRGCRQVVDHGGNGLLVPVGDASRLAEAIDRLGSEPDLRKRMGVSSGIKARSEFDERRVVDIVMKTYFEVARRKGLGWAFSQPAGEVTIRPARADDALAVAELHRQMISTGFLSSLGTGFLHLLYRSMVEMTGGRVLVAESEGVVTGFVAGTRNTGDFYKRFVRRHGFLAALRAAPTVFKPRVLKGIWETLRYGDKGGSGVTAELLAMAVAPSLQGQGLGTRLVQELLEWAIREGIGAMRVVVGSANYPAIGLYRGMGFGAEQSIEVHKGQPSWELVWTR